MTRHKWEIIFSGVQAGSGVAVAALAFWAFFFSSLSQRLEDHLRTEATLAKQDLIAAREAKAAVETENNRLAVVRDSLRTELHSLEQRISLATSEIASLNKERTAYAQSTRSLAYSRYYLMAEYELATMQKIAEICAGYGQHRRWLAMRRELAKLEGQWESLPSAQKHDPTLPINKRMEELSEERYKTNDLWFRLPSPPTIAPSGGNRIVFTAHDLKLMDRDNHEELNAYVISWLLDRIAIPRGVRPQTGAVFIDQTKKYGFLDELLPKEREEFHSKIDGFLQANPRFGSLQLNVTVPNDPSPNDIIAAGKRMRPDVGEFQKAFLAHLSSVGMGVGAMYQDSK